MKISWFKLKFRIFQKKWELLVYGTSFIFSIILGTFIQTIVLFISFNILRPYFPKTFHHEEFSCCIRWSLLMFFSSVIELLLFPVTISISGGIFIATLCCYILYLVEDYVESYRIKNNNKDKSIFEMSESEIIDYCYAHNIRKDIHIKFVLLAINQVPFYDISQKLGYAEPTLKDWSKLCKKKLNIKSWKRD